MTVHKKIVRKNVVRKNATEDTSALGILTQASQVHEQRGVEYDSEHGERSMPLTITLFNTLTGHRLSVADGFKLMQILKMVRIQQAPHKVDSYIDLAGYAALEGESSTSET